MLLKDLVEVNQKGNVANAVSFDLMDDPDTNQDLCDSFIFNYDPKKPELSTIGILDRLKESFHSRNEPNVHMMIQPYGRGKSHFAVVLANFFAKSADSPEIKGILAQVNTATSGPDKIIGERLKAYKERQQRNHLVLCLSGDKGGDIRKQFLQVLTETLEKEGVAGAIASHICREPLNYLESLTPENHTRAEAYLESLGNPDGDINGLMKQLRANNPSVIRAVKELCRHVTGVTPDFQDDIQIERILRDLLDRFCSGEDPRFSGILILFDEMNYYLQSWAADQIGAGGTAIQNITNICEVYKGKIAFLSFTQINPEMGIGISKVDVESYKKLVSRLMPQESTYNGPASSLELVIDNMLDQKEESPSWQSFLQRWQDTLLGSATDAFEKHVKLYQSRGWTRQYFYDHLGKGCFPLHPITASLLCNLSFTQSRTAIQFIKGYVHQFIEDYPVEDNDHLSYIYPIDLVDNFLENFVNDPVYKRYQEAQAIVSGSEDPNELKALKALFLFIVSGDKLNKGDREDHEDILGALAGLSKPTIKAALEKLQETRDLIFYKPEIKLYRFWEGISPKGIEEEIEDQIRHQTPTLQRVVSYCQGNRASLFRKEHHVATQFVQTKGLVPDDWRFEIKFYSPDSLISTLINSERAFHGTEEKGIFAYVLAETQEELQSLRRTIEDHLASSPNKDHIAIAIPSEEAGDLPQLLLKITTLRALDSDRKRQWGTTACDQLEKRWLERLVTRLGQVLGSCSYHALPIALNGLTPEQRRHPSAVASALLQYLFPLVPTVAGENKLGIDRMRNNHATGKKIVGLVASQLFADTLSPQTLPKESFYKDVITQLFITKWGMIKASNNRYTAQVPTNEIIRAAWQEIDRITALKEDETRKTTYLRKLWEHLSAPPYGYSKYTFIALLSGWLAYHRHEVLLEGDNAVDLKAKEQATRKTLSLQEWGNTPLLLSADPNKLVDKWIVARRAVLVRKQRQILPELPKSPMDLSAAEAYLQEAQTFLEATEVSSEEKEGVQRSVAKVESALAPILEWLRPVEQVECLPEVADIQLLLKLYSQLRQPLPPLSLTADSISVRPGTAQRERHTSASQAIATRLDNYTDEISEQSETLNSLEACDAYQNKVQSLITLYEEAQDLPSHLVDCLQNALQVAARVRVALEQDSQIAELVRKAQAGVQTLHDFSSQADFQRILTDLEKVQQQIPPNRTEFGQIQRLWQDTDRQYQELNQKLADGEERLASLTTRTQIVTLLQDVAQLNTRFTEPESQKRLVELQEKLNRSLINIDSTSQTETLLKAELENARQNLQRLRDLSDDKISEAAHAYQELERFEFTEVSDNALLKSYQKKLNGFKSQGHELLTNRFQKICDQQLTQLSDYASRKDNLTRAIAAASGINGFEATSSNLSQSLNNLEAQAENLRHNELLQQQKLADQQTLKAIQQLRPSRNSSLQNCEMALQQIQQLKAQLHNPDALQAEITQIISACEEKIQSYHETLADLQAQLAKVTTTPVFKDLQIKYIRAEADFRDSSESDAYQVLGNRLRVLEEDLTKLDVLEDQCRQANTIAACRDFLEDLAAPNLLSEPDHFMPNRIAQLISQSQQKIQTYQQELAQLNQKLAYVSSPAEIQSIRKTLLIKEACYQATEEADNVSALQSELDVLEEIMPLMNLANAGTLDACNRQIQQLTARKESSADLSERLLERIDSGLTELEGRQQKLLAEKRDSAHSWLKRLSEKVTQMTNAFREQKRYELAKEIIESFEQNSSIHMEFLPSAERRLLEQIVREALEVQSQSTSNEIIRLFKQLKTPQRQSLYTQLEQYLTDPTEEKPSNESESNLWQRLFGRDHQKMS